MPGFLKEQISILFQKYGTRVPDCHRCSKAVTNLIPPADEKIIQIKNYRNLKISPILKTSKVAQRTKVVLISLNSRLGLTVKYKRSAVFREIHCQPALMLISGKMLNCCNSTRITLIQCCSTFFFIHLSLTLLSNFSLYQLQCLCYSSSQDLEV